MGWNLYLLAPLAGGQLQLFTITTLYNYNFGDPQFLQLTITIIYNYNSLQLQFRSVHMTNKLFIYKFLIARIRFLENPIASQLKKPYFIKTLYSFEFNIDKTFAFEKKEKNISIDFFCGSDIF
jgi:hypothetical protein